MQINSQNRLTVGVSDARFSKNQADVIVTHSLGSCIGVCVYDRVKKCGAMLHFQLPDSKLDPEKALKKPCMFADSGVKLILQSMHAAGCRKHSMVVKIAGGAAMKQGPASFDIGHRNHLAIRKALWQAGLMIESEDVGGDMPRSLFMQISTGKILMKKRNETSEL